MASKPARNPGHTTLKTFGRTIRDEPHHLVYPIRLYAKRQKLSAEALNDWCSVRYLNTRRKTGARYRIETYKHQDGKRYVNRVFFEKLSDEDMVELKMRFGDFVQGKQVRTGKLTRPRLTKEEKKQRDAWLDQFYADVRARRMAAIEEQKKADEFA